MTYKRQTETENLLGTPRYERENNSWQRSNEKSIASTSTIFFLENGALTFTRCIEIFLDLSISLHPFSQRLDRARASTVAQWKMHVETLGNQLDRRSVNGRVGKDFLSLSLSRIPRAQRNSTRNAVSRRDRLVATKSLGGSL